MQCCRRTGKIHFFLCKFDGEQFVCYKIIRLIVSVYRNLSYEFMKHSNDNHTIYARVEVLLKS